MGSPYIMRKRVSSMADLIDGTGVLVNDLGVGNIYYVNGGSDGPTNNNLSGEDKDNPKQTITAALALCTSGHNDYIRVLNYGSNGRASETWPIAVTQDMVHIIGDRSTVGSKWATVTATGSNKAAFEVTGARVEIANLEIGGTAAGNNAGILVGNLAGVWGCTIHDCWFGVADGAGSYGIKVTATYDAPYLTVYDCIFGEALLIDGILIAGVATRGKIGMPGHGNLFHNIAGIAINVTGSTVGLNILDNRFQLKADTAGDAITLPAGSSSCYISGNQAGYSKAAVTTKYYVDAGTGNDWDNNYVSGSLLFPT